MLFFNRSTITTEPPSKKAGVCHAVCHDDNLQGGEEALGLVISSKASLNDSRALLPKRKRKGGKVSAKSE